MFLSDEIIFPRWNTSQSIRLIQTLNNIKTFIKGKDLTSQIHSLAIVKLFEDGKRNSNSLFKSNIAYNMHRLTNLSIIIDGFYSAKINYFWKI